MAGETLKKRGMKPTPATNRNGKHDKLTLSRPVTAYINRIASLADTTPGMVVSIMLARDHIRLEAEKKRGGPIASEVHVTPARMEQLRRCSEITLMPPQTILDEESREGLTHLENKDDSYYIETMEVWLMKGLYPPKVRAEVRARIREFTKGCTAEERAFLHSLAAEKAKGALS